MFFLTGVWFSLQVFHRELEKLDQFEKLNDFIGTYALRRGKTKTNLDDDKSSVGEFKVRVLLAHMCN